MHILYKSISATFRDGLPNIYKSSSQNKVANRRLANKERIAAGVAAATAATACARLLHDDWDAYRDHKFDTLIDTEVVNANNFTSI